VNWINAASTGRAGPPRRAGYAASAGHDKSKSSASPRLPPGKMASVGEIVIAKRTNDKVVGLSICQFELLVSSESSFLRPTHIA